MIGWFSINSRYTHCSLVGCRVNLGFVFFVAVVLPDHCGQNTVKGRLTQASKEKWRQALRGFFGGQVTERGRKRIHCFDKPDRRISTICRDGTTHGAPGLVSTSRRFWLPGTSTERRQALPPELQSACPLLKCRSCLLLNDGATRLEFNWADPCRRVTMSFLDQGSTGWPGKIYTHLTQPGFPWLVLVRSASQ